MSPVSDFISQLFPKMEEDNILHFSCGHVIAKKQLMPLIISTGFTGKEFNFSYQHREDKGMVLNY